MTVLLVEDNHQFSQLIEMSLEEDVHVVQSLEAAKGWLEQCRADMILLDLGLPDSQGLDTLRALAKVKVPKIVLTAATDQAVEAAQLGATDYVLKTKEIGEIVRRIQFNINRLAKRTRFAPAVFAQIKACLLPVHEGVRELTAVR